MGTVGDPEDQWLEVLSCGMCHWASFNTEFLQVSSNGWYCSQEAKLGGTCLGPNLSPKSGQLVDLG